MAIFSAVTMDTESIAHTKIQTKGSNTVELWLNKAVKKVHSTLRDPENLTVGTGPATQLLLYTYNNTMF